jgi:hypothetical protein
MEICGRSKQVILSTGAPYICRAGREFNYLRPVEARDRNWRIGGCVLAKGEEAFPDSRHSTAIVSLRLEAISHIEMQIRCRRIQKATSAYL